MKSIFKNDVLAILKEYPKTRDDIDLLCKYVAKNHEVNCKAVLIIDRLSRHEQGNNPELRGDKWKDRQKFSNQVRKERAQEKPENLNKIYTVAEDKSYIFQKETKWQQFKRFISF